MLFIACTLPPILDCLGEKPIIDVCQKM